jgi:hypothetical protein
MKNAGFKLVIMGAESFSSGVLSNMGKNLVEGAERVVRASEDCLNAKITPLMNLILFYPTATLDDIDRTIDISSGLVRKGARVNAYSYVEAYSGARIMGKDYPISYEKGTIGKSVISVPKFVHPKHPDVRALAEQALEMRESLVQEHIRGIDGPPPHPIHSLCLFLAFKKITGRDASFVEDALAGVKEEAI